MLLNASSYGERGTLRVLVCEDDLDLANRSPSARRLTQLSSFSLTAPISSETS
jgi:hypothetical protein